MTFLKKQQKDGWILWK